MHIHHHFVGGLAQVHDFGGPLQLNHHLPQDFLLHLIILVDERSHSARQPVLEILLLEQVVKHGHSLVFHQGGGVAGMQAVRADLAKVHRVDVGLLDGEQVGHFGVGPLWHSSVPQVMNTMLPS